MLGPNGAGKTTTISMLTGIFPPTSGTARIGGYDIVKQLDRVKRINGLVPQDLALYPTLSARANINFFGNIYGLPGDWLRCGGRTRPDGNANPGHVLSQRTLDADSHHRRDGDNAAIQKLRQLGLVGRGQLAQ